MDPDLYQLIQQAISTGITTTQIVTAIVAFLAAALGAWISSYFSKKAEFAALKEDFNESLELLRRQTETVEQTKAEVAFNALKESFQESLDQLKRQTEVVEQTKAEVEELHNVERLAFELQKTRGVERQELRYESYGLLWAELRRLAIYDESVINKKVVGELSNCLSNWYFSMKGGLLLTPQARDFYFALQDLLRYTFNVTEDWEADRSSASEGKEREIFKEVLSRLTDEKYKDRPEKPSDVFQYFRDADFKGWTDKAPAKGNLWRDGIKDVAKEWDKLNGEERFATLQQVGSILRTSLTNDLESRLG